MQGRDRSVRDALSQGHIVQDSIVQGKTFGTLWSGIHELALKPDAEGRVTCVGGGGGLLSKACHVKKTTFLYSSSLIHGGSQRPYIYID